MTTEPSAIFNKPTSLRSYVVSWATAATEMLLSLLSRINLLRATSLSHPDRLQENLNEIDFMLEHIQARDHIRNAEKSALAVLEQQAPLPHSQV